MAKRKRRPIDRRFLRQFVARMEAAVGAAAGTSPITREAIDQWAAENLDGKSRAEREKASGGPFLIFVTDQLRRATWRIMAMHAGEHPSPN